MLELKDKDWLNGYKKQDPYICCLQETHFRHIQTKNEVMEKDIPCMEIKRKLEEQFSYQTK